MIHLHYAGLCSGLGRKVCPLVAALASALLIPGCGGGNSAGNSPPSNPPPDPPITASVHGLTGGGHTVIKGASVTLYRVGTGGYGSPAAVLGKSTTDASGAWTVTFAMPADDPLVYITASGGDLGRGANRNVSFTPDLDGVVPNDWMLAINFTGGALDGMVPKGPPSGGPLGLSTIGTSPQGIAIDPSGNVWVATGEAEGVVELIGAAVPVKTPRNGPVVRP